MTNESPSTLNIDQIVVGRLFTNCYIVNDGTVCVIIDPGDNFERIDSFIVSKHLRPVAVLATHGHFDHVLAAPGFLSKYGLKLKINEEDVDVLAQAAEMSLTFTGISPNGKIEYDTFSDGEEFTLGEHTIVGEKYPGHTPGSTIFEAGNTWIAGDTLFKGNIGRVDFGGSMESMKHSLRKIRQVEQNYNILPGHGELTTLEEEKVENPFLTDEFLSE